MGRRKHKAIQTNTIDVMLKILLLESFNFETCRIKNFRSPRGLGREASRTMKFSSLPLGTMSRAEAIEEGNFLIFPIIRNLLVRQSQRAWHRRIFMMENCWHISSIVIQLPFVAPSSVEALLDAPWRPLILQINWCGRETFPWLAVHAQTNPKLLQYSKWLSRQHEVYRFLSRSTTRRHQTNCVGGLSPFVLELRGKMLKAFQMLTISIFLFICFDDVVFFIFPYFFFRSLQPHKSLKTRITGRKQRRIQCEANPFKIKRIFDELWSH